MTLLDLSKPVQQRCGRAAKIFKERGKHGILLGIIQDFDGEWETWKWKFDGRSYFTGSLSDADLINVPEPKSLELPAKVKFILDHMPVYWVAADIELKNELYKVAQSLWEAMHEEMEKERGWG